MSRVRWHVLVFAVVCAFGFPAIAEAACGSSGYTYAGVAATQQAFGVRTRLSALALPQVLNGHVAGWVGVGGPGAGPNSSDEWIQVGFSAFPGSQGNTLYYEVARPGSGAHYYEVEQDIAATDSRRIAVLEMAHRANWWRVWVDGSPVSDPVYLPASHGKWRPIATAESWGGGSRVCNRFRYQFQYVSLASRPGGAWHGLQHSYTIRDPGYSVIRRTPASFLATVL
jgi:hypothetical protein